MIGHVPNGFGFFDERVDGVDNTTDNQLRFHIYISATLHKSFGHSSRILALIDFLI